MNANTDCAILEIKDVTYKYGKEPKSNYILKNANYRFSAGKMYALLGKSGIGKSTTLSLLGALDFPQEGEIRYKGQNIQKIGYQEYRKQIVSTVFQDYNLLPYLSGLQNIELAMRAEKDKALRQGKIAGYLESVGITIETANRNVRKLSGGEQQRIAIARTMAMDTPIILADEPTGNLDADTAGEIIEILCKAASEQEKCVIAVTHTPELAKRADVVLKIENSQIILQK